MLRRERIAVGRTLERLEVEITLTEGRYHQVRRMFAATGNHVAALQRIAIGGLRLTGLSAGEWRAASIDDARALGAMRPLDTAADA